MTAFIAGASLSSGRAWMSIDWDRAEAEVKKLQMRIAKAVREERWNRVKALQRILTRSFYAKLLAVNRVTKGKGSSTPGVDNIIWKTSAKKMMGALSLQQRGYKASPLRRVHIPKGKNGKRPLGIPTIRDRAMQALYLLALEPVSETLADPNSYGFRCFRACRDAIAQCFLALARKCSARWVLDADIKACFDGISHQWILDHIPVEKKILEQWLKCGFIEKRKLFPTRAGSPQGGVISPTLCNMTLDGLEKAVKAASHRREKVNFIRYADDFVVTSASKEHLENVIVPVIKKFLTPRGLTLSEEKTRIVHIDEGFDFLGQNLRKYRGQLITIPAKDKVKTFKEKVKNIIEEYRGQKTEEMIERLNPIIRGWANYHRFIQAGTEFNRLGGIIREALFTWAKRRHGRKTPKWIMNHYWNISRDKLHFSCVVKTDDNKSEVLQLLNPSDIRLARYIKVKGQADPFNPEYQEYFRYRQSAANMSLLDGRGLSAAGLL